MRPVTSSRYRPIHRPLAAFLAAVSPWVRSLPVSRPGTPPALVGPYHRPEGLQAPSPRCLRPVGLSLPLLQAEIPLCAIGTLAPHDLPVS
ncbi:hypothetical protein T05_7633 [Trichinella murrelli]|uniref:Uncharacterized protein n=1 Tax=Trichinella murrelli TaxID=144512 RepID=A0A0V0T2E1_9BILA|nr:hypothetical protein T05_7633 [Trichinella murrelli]